MIPPMVAVLATLATVVSGQPPEPTARPDAWRTGVREVAEKLPELHPGWFTHTTETEWDLAVAGLHERIPTLDEQALALELMRLVALGKDSHTAVRLPAVSPPLDTLPLRFVVMDDGVFVAAAAEPHHGLIGARVVRFGPLDSDAAIDLISTMYAWENESWRRRTAAAFLSIPVALEMIGATPDRAAIDLTLEHQQEGIDSLTATVRSIPPGGEGAVWTSWLSRLEGAVPMATKGRSTFYRSEFLADSGVMYVQFNKCADAPDMPFADFARFVLTKCEELDARRIVLDLRENTGGNEGVILPLTVPLSVMERFREPGSIVCLIGPGTYSSGMGNAISLSRIGAVLIGQPTGGRPNSFGEVRSFPVEALGTVVYYSTRRWTKLPDTDPDSLMPDLTVPRLGEDLLTGRDRALEAAIAYRATIEAEPDP